MYYDVTVKCYTWKSLILAAVALTVLAVFILSVPKVHVSHCCGFQRWHALHMFVEPFQGQYKDGTIGTHDFRMVSASFLLLQDSDAGLNFHDYTWSKSFMFIFC